MSIKNIGILTSGGDCGGLNGVIKGIALNARSKDIKSFLIPNGYAGLYNLIDLPSIPELTFDRLTHFHVYEAGSEAGNSRVQIKKIKDDNKYERIKAGLKKFNIDVLIIAGGDDTGSVVVDLGKQGFPCIHAPKTMDLDLMPYSVGGDSTINRIAEIVRDLKTTARTHNRVMVVEVFGRYAGHTALRGGVAAEADVILIPEIPVDFDYLYKHIKHLFMHRIGYTDVNSGEVAIVVAEGLKDAAGNELVDMNSPVDAFGHRKLIGAGKYVVKQIEDRMKTDSEVKQLMKESGFFVPGVFEVPEVRDVRPGHLVRSGFTSAYDANFGMEVGAAAVLLALQGIFGVTVVGYNEGLVRYMDSEEAIAQRHVDLSSVYMFEEMGICFGRKPVPSHPAFEKISGRPARFY